MGSAGHNPQKGDKVLALSDQHGSVGAPVPVAPIPETAMGRWPQGRQALQQGAKEVGGDLRGASLNLDGGCDAAHKRQGRCQAGRLPNLTEHPRNRQPPQRGRKRFRNDALQALRMRVERTLAWEDTFKRLLLRLERSQQRHYGLQLRAYTLINLRKFCGT